MKQVNKFLKKYNIKPDKYIIKGKTYIVIENDKKYIVKEKINKEIINYLKSRNFDNIPKLLIEDNYFLIEYLEDLEGPKEQKLLDLIKIVAMLHNKTTFYKEVDIGEYKEIYETIKNNIAHLISYYNDIITLIESHVFMSPSEYLLARNISQFFKALNFCNIEIDKWYELIKNQTKQRVVVLHNNLNLTNFIKNEKAYLISWDKSKFGIPIFDLYKLYLNIGIYFDYEELLKAYLQLYPLKEEEQKLLFVLLAMPAKININKNNIELTREITNKIEIMYRVEKLISPYYSEQS